MNIEIERKYLVTDDSWKDHAGEGVACRQGYLVSDDRKTVRVRIYGEKGVLTAKGATKGISRAEYEYEIGLDDAADLLELCDQVVEKVRYVFDCCGSVWELDVFSGANEGLILAEVELEDEDQQVSLPDWVGKEVSGDLRYYNACLAQHPYSKW